MDMNMSLSSNNYQFSFKSKQHLKIYNTVLKSDIQILLAYFHLKGLSINTLTAIGIPSNLIVIGFHSKRTTLLYTRLFLPFPPLGKTKGPSNSGSCASARENTAFSLYIIFWYMILQKEPITRYDGSCYRWRSYFGI